MSLDTLNQLPSQKAVNVVGTVTSDEAQKLASLEGAPEQGSPEAEVLARLGRGILDAAGNDVRPSGIGERDVAVVVDEAGEALANQSMVYLTEGDEGTRVSSRIEQPDPADALAMARTQDMLRDPSLTDNQKVNAIAGLTPPKL